MVEIKTFFLKDIKSCAITKQNNFLVASLKNYIMLIWKLAVCVICRIKRFQKKKCWKNYFSILQLVCKRFKFCDFKILFAVATVSISIIWKNKSSTFSCSWVKTFNNTILIGKKIGQKNWYLQNFFRKRYFLSFSVGCISW